MAQVESQGPPAQELEHGEQHSLSSEEISPSKEGVGSPWNAGGFWSLRKVVVLAVICSVLLALALGLGLGLGLKHPHQHRNNKGPNVLVIMPDDQGKDDHLLDSLSVQPKVTGLIGGNGVTYQNHYCTVAWCCPSRVNYFTGRAAHNTNITSAQAPYGGWTKFGELGLNDNYLPVWLSDAGVNTYYVGKFLNGFKNWNLATPAPPKGWTDSSFLVEPWTYNYFNSHYTNKVNAESESDITGYPGIHTSVITQQKALAMLDDAANRGGQFYMQVAPVAPHEQLGANTTVPPMPPGYEGAFADRQAPRTENFNPDQPSGSSWVKQLPKLDSSAIAHGDKIYNHRLGNLAYIDDMVANIIQKLDDLDMLNNTYIIYTTDNGFHIGNHRMEAGKRTCYEEDINIPLLIRGPDVAQGVVTDTVNTHTDMAPTILQMLGIPLRDEFDGAPIAYTAADVTTVNKTELVNVEFWNSDSTGTTHNNTYKALRLISDEYNFMYSKWCTGENEFYDMQNDPQQMQNRLANPPQGVATKYYGRNESALFDRLNALLMVTKSCKQDSCRAPWEELFPGGQVFNLTDAMRPEYDTFFATQPKVSFPTGCNNYYIPADEGPQNVNAYGSSNGR